MVISPESIIDTILPSLGEICLSFIESGELNVSNRNDFNNFNKDMPALIGK